MMMVWRGGGGGGRGGDAVCGPGCDVVWPCLLDGGYRGLQIECETVPTNRVGLVVGRGGAHIKHIKAETGAYVSLESKCPKPDTPVYIIGYPDEVEKVSDWSIEERRGPGGKEEKGPDPIFSEAHHQGCLHGP